MSTILSTLKLLLLVVAFSFGTHAVYAVSITENFDSHATGTAVRDLEGFSPITSSNQYIVNDNRSFSPSNSMYHGSSGSGNYLYANIGVTQHGAFTASVYSDGGNQYYCLTAELLNQYVCLDFQTYAPIQVLADFGGGETPIYTFSATTSPSEWHALTIEYEVINSQMYMQFTIGDQQSPMMDVGYPTSEYSTLITRFVGFPTSLNSLDNFYLITDDDYITPSETEIPTGVTNEYDTQLTSANVGCSSDCIDVGYLIDSTELVTTNPSRWIEHISMYYTTGTSSTLYSVRENLDPYSGSGSIPFDVSFLDDGDYEIMFRYTNNGTVFTGVYPFEHASIQMEMTIASGTIASISTVALNTSESYNDIETNKPCSITQIMGCIENAGRFLFVPSTAQLQNFREFQEQLPERYPFAWFFGVEEVISNTQQGSEGFPTVEIDLPLIGTSFVILSQGTIDSVWPTDVRVLFKNICAWFLWISFFSMAFFSIGNLFGWIGGGNSEIQNEYGRVKVSRSRM